MMFGVRKIDTDILRVEKPAFKLPSYRGTHFITLMPDEGIITDGPIRATQIDDSVMTRTESDDELDAEWDDIIEPDLDHCYGI